MTRAVAFGGPTTITLAGGIGPDGSTTSSVELIDLTTSVVSGLPPLAQPVHDAAAGVAGSTQLVMGGGATIAEDIVQSIETSRASQIVGHLGSPRADGSGATVGTEAVLAGGWNGSTLDKRVLATTDGSSFQVAGRLAVPVRYPAVAAVGTRLFVVGGVSANGRFSDAIQVVDIETGAASIVGHLPAAFAEATAVVVGGQILVCGGRDTDGPRATMIRIDPATGSATVIGSLPSPVADAAGAEVGGNGYLLGGERKDALASIIEVGAAAP